MRKYSRLVTVQEKKHKRQAFFWMFLSVALLIALAVWGIPTLAKMAAFIADLKVNKTTTKNDTFAPAPPLFTISDTATNSAQFKVEGTAESKTTLTLYQSGKNETALAVDDNGTFKKDVVLLDGENRFTAKVKDESGNESQESKPLTIRYDTTPPEITITQPKDNQTFSGKQQQTLAILGSTDEDATVMVNNRVVTSLQNNQFSFQTALQDGTNEFDITATDTAGNKADKKITVTFYQ